MTGTIPALGNNEKLLILNCSRLELVQNQVQIVEKLLRNPLSWEVLLAYAELHSVAPLLYRNLTCFEDPQLLPREVKRRLLALSQRTEFQNQLISKELASLLDLFSAGSIDVIIPKGILLVQRIYKNLSLRPLIDINILISEANIPAAKEILLQNGYRLHPSDPYQGNLFSQFHLQKRRGFDFHLLLQWHLINWEHPHNMKMVEIWNSARQVSLSNRNTLILCPEDLVIYLCIQAQKFAGLNPSNLDAEDPSVLVFEESTNHRLIRFVDLYEVANYYRNSVDWRLVSNKARIWGFQNLVSTSLNWINKIFGTIAPLEAFTY